MPLKPGSSRATIQENIRKLIAEGYTPQQAAAIAYAEARKRK
jgi:biotin operon repressor